MTTESTAFLKEVDEFLRYEKMTKLWKQYKYVVYVGVAGLFFIVGGNTYYSQQKEVSLTNEASNWWAVTQVKSPEEAVTALNKVVTENAFGYRMLARMELARVALKENNLEKALLEFRALKNDKNADVLHRDMAAFFEGQILMETSPKQAKTIFTALDNSNSPFKFSVLEMMAMMAETAGNKTEAVALYERIAEVKDITPAMRSRAQNRIRALGIK